MRAVIAQMRQAVAEDGLPPGHGAAIMAAGDGLFMARIFGLYAYDSWTPHEVITMTAGLRLDFPDLRLDAVLADLGDGATKAMTTYVLEEDARDLRDGPLASDDVVVFVGDNHGFDEATRENQRALWFRQL